MCHVRYIYTWLWCVVIWLGIVARGKTGKRGGDGEEGGGESQPAVLSYDSGYVLAHIHVFPILRV
jgi:hypothetical protein